jgi:hypothetical protein
MIKEGLFRMKLVGALSLLAAFLLLTCGSAMARDLGTSLVNSEQRVTTAEADLAAKERRLEEAEARYRAASKRAAAPVRELNTGRSEVQSMRRNLAAEEKRADTRIAALEQQRRQEVDDHDEEVRTGVGFGLAALVAGLIALGWGWFRATGVVAALTRIELGQAIGLCVGGGLLVLIVGAVLGSSTGALGAVGSFIFCLGLILPAALLWRVTPPKCNGGGPDPSFVASGCPRGPRSRRRP